MNRESFGTSYVRSSNPSKTGRQTQISAAIVLAVLLLGLVLVYVFKMYSAYELAGATASDIAAAPPVDVATVNAVPPTMPLKLPGETAAWYEATIYSRVNGYVGKWSVDIGDHVKAGQILATIVTPELDAELAAAQAKLNAADAGVLVRQAQAEFADTTYQRWKNSPKGVVSEQETEDKKASYASAKAELTAARAQVGVAQDDVDRLNAFQKFKQVVAPFDGIVTERKIDIGNLVTAGSSASMVPLYRIAQNDPIRVFVQVPQDAAASMKVGTAVDIMTDGTNSQTFSGTIARTSNAVDPQARTLRVEVDIPNHTGILISGLYVEAIFHVPSKGVSEVPAAAMIFRSEGPEVAVVKGDHLEFRKVSIAEDNGNIVDLTSGVQPGENVVLNISSALADGEKVAVSAVDGQPIAQSRAIIQRAEK
jgi:RND family efflux transporter MFP subunit